MDQPLFAISKQIQWQQSNLGEDKYVVMMGPLHIEMMLLKTVGDWLEGSGWSDALAEAGITTQGRADSLTKASTVARSRYAHQVLIHKTDDENDSFHITY